MLTLGCIIWNKVANDGGVIQKLSRLNRLAAVCMFPMRRGTPTAALEVILDLPPVDLVIKERALCSMLRISHHNRSLWDGCGKSLKLGHIRSLQNQLQEYGIDEKVFDETKTLNIQKDYTVDLKSFRSGLPDSQSEVQCFTDGSKKDNQVGYGFGIFQGQIELATENGFLGKCQTVFQAEVTAIHKACELLNDFRAKSITIFSDSQAAIAALAGFKVNSKTVENCIDSLNQLGTTSNVEIKYVKAHCGIDHNETADRLAKLGTKNTHNIITTFHTNSSAKNID